MVTRILLAALILCIGIISVFFVFFRTSFLPSSENLVQDFSFEQTTGSFPTPWFFQVQPSAAGTITQEKTHTTNGSYCAKIAILSSSTKSYDVQLQQRNISLQANYRYTISFDAKADSKRTITVASQNGIAPYAGYTNRTFSITQNWHTYTFFFTALQTDQNSLLNFNLAKTTGTVWLDNIRIMQTTPSRPEQTVRIITGNMIQNDSFEDTQNEFPYRWIFQTQKNAAAEVLLDDAETKDGAFSVKTTIQTPGQHPYDIQLIQQHIPLIRDKTYRINLFAKATSSRFFSITLQKPTAPYTTYASNLFVLHDDWQPYSYFFTAPFSDANAQIALNMGRAKGNVWFDGVSLVPTISPTPVTYTGKKSQAIYTGVALDGIPGDMTMLSQFETDASKAASLYGLYQPWGGSDKIRTFQPTWMNAIRKYGAIPLITWEPWDRERGKTQAAYRLQNIIDGKFDAYINKFARAARIWGHPFFLRFAHEMNTDTYPWSELVNDNKPGQYVQAWKHVYTLFANQGVTNVTWVWSPYRKTDGSIPLSELYPGDDYVHWVGIDGYNWGADGKQASASFASVFQQTYNETLSLTKKPIMIGEMASYDEKGSKATWITDAYTNQLPHNFPAVKAVVWFNYNKEHDWRIASSPQTQQAFVKALASPYYLDNRFSAFNSTPIPDPSVVDLPSLINLSDEK